MGRASTSHDYVTKGRYTLPVHTALMYGPYDLRPISMDAFLTPVFTARIYGCQKVHPYIWAVYMARTSHPKNPRIYICKHYVTTESFYNQNILNSTNIRCSGASGIKKSTSRRVRCRPRTVCPSIAEYAPSSSITLISPIRDLNNELVI